MLPNFFVIGAAKCGTTSLCALLGQHPQVFMSNPKELHFFSKDCLFTRGLEWYEAYFREAQDEIAVGEGSTTYSNQCIYPDAPERIAQYLPRGRLIYIVRHPLDRILSNWLYVLHIRKWPHVRKSLDETVRRWPRYINVSMYWKQISVYRRHFSDAQILPLFFEDLIATPGPVMRRCFEFLGVDPCFRAEGAKVPRNPTRATGLALRGARRLRLGELGRMVLPEWMLTWIRNSLSRPIERPEWPLETNRFVVEHVEEDARRFLSYCGKPEDFWQFGDA